MTDKALFQKIRKLVKQQKQRNLLDRHRQDFAQEYCRLQILKKKQIRHREQTKLNNLFKNFKNVESYINIMDIIKDLDVSFEEEEGDTQKDSKNKEELPEIIPKSLQMKMKEKLGPILNQKYQEEAEKRQIAIQQLKSQIDYGNNMDIEGSGILKEMKAGIENQRVSDKMQEIDMLRKDIKRKQVYFIQKRFDDEMKEIGKTPIKIQNTKLFHKICSYLHMILEQEHKEKWASREDKKMRQARRQNSKKLIRVSGLATPTLTEKNSMFNRSVYSRFLSSNKNSGEDLKMTDHGVSQIESDSFDTKKDSNSLHKQNRATIDEKVKRLHTTKELLKQNFTFRKRNVKAGLMVKINDFVDTLNGEEKKNMELSKKYGNALQSLSEEIKSSYSRFEREQIAQDEDIEQMKKYLDNTLSRNKKDLKKFHHK